MKKTVYQHQVLFSIVLKEISYLYIQRLLNIMPSYNDNEHKKFTQFNH